MPLLNLPALQNASLHLQPYPYTVIEHFVDPAYQAELESTFPMIQQDGSFPISAFQLTGAMQELIRELQSPTLQQAIASKLNMDLTSKPHTITLRGFCTKGRDGKIHTDSKDKLVTVLVYLGGDWQEGQDAGCLRLLNNHHDLNDYAAQIPPRFGTCVLFKVTDNGWHGFHAFQGQRRAIQLNYVVSARAATKNIWRHKLAAFFKQLF